MQIGFIYSYYNYKLDYARNYYVDLMPGVVKQIKSFDEYRTFDSCADRLVHIHTYIIAHYSLSAWITAQLLTLVHYYGINSTPKNNKQWLGMNIFSMAYEIMNQKPGYKKLILASIVCQVVTRMMLWTLEVMPQTLHMVYMYQYTKALMLG